MAHVMQKLEEMARSHPRDECRMQTKQPCYATKCWWSERLNTKEEIMDMMIKAKEALEEAGKDASHVDDMIKTQNDELQAVQDQYNCKSLQHLDEKKHIRLSNLSQPLDAKHVTIVKALAGLGSAIVTIAVNFRSPLLSELPSWFVLPTLQFVH
jgi:hypothetical protein